MSPRRPRAALAIILLLLGAAVAATSPSPDLLSLAAADGPIPWPTPSQAPPATPVDGPVVTEPAPPPPPPPETTPPVTEPAPPPPETIPPVTEPAPPTPEPAPVGLRPVTPSTPPELPTGKGMWTWQVGRTEGGDVNAIVAKARAVGLTHLYVRTGSSKDGFYAAPFLDAILPAAHAAGIRVIAWDFPYFDDVASDVGRAIEAIAYRTPGGERIDGFDADIESPSEGVNLTPENASDYGTALRQYVGPDYPLIVTVPRPSPQKQASYPYEVVTYWFSAISPMVYWLDKDPSVVKSAIEYFAPTGKKILPVGQAYDGTAEGGRPGPPPEEIGSFLVQSAEEGASAISFWSWQHASDDTWTIFANAPQFTVPETMAPPG